MARVQPDTAENGEDDGVIGNRSADVEIFRFLIVLIASAVVLACVGDPAVDQAESSASDARLWARGPTVNAGLDATFSDDTLFSLIYDVAIDSQGRLYVADGQAGRVVVLSSDLKYERTVGTKGEGPGEFQTASSLQILPGDSLLVFDASIDRVTVFAPGDSVVVAYTQDFRATGINFANVLKLPGQDEYLGQASLPYYADARDEGVSRVDVLRRLSTGHGTISTDSLWSFPSDEALVLRQGDSRGGAVSVAGHPFGRRSFLTVLDGERAVYVSSLSLEVTILHVLDQTLRVFGYDTTPIPVTRQELRAAERQLGRSFTRLLREGAPYTWPAIVGMLVDDRGRIWVGIRGAERAMREWGVFHPTGTHLASVRLPSEFRPYAVRGGRIMGVIRDELDVPSILVYGLAPSVLDGSRETSSMQDQ